MRVIAESSHQEFKISIYHSNKKYFLKLEKGSYEQVYKINDMEVSSEEDIKKISLDEGFVKAAIDRFREMNKSLNEALNRI